MARELSLTIGFIDAWGFNLSEVRKSKVSEIRQSWVSEVRQSLETKLCRTFNGLRESLLGMILHRGKFS